MLFFHHIFFYNVIKYSIGVSSISLSIFTRSDKNNMQVKFISSISFNMPAIYPHYIRTYYITRHTTIHWDRTIYLCLPPFFLWMLPCNHLNISTFKFHLKILFKKFRSSAQLSPSFISIMCLCNNSMFISEY